MAKIIMIQGTCSNAGKSLLCAALCRIFRQDGYRVAPFKSQNMALNSFITADGREMGRAQVVQAEAAGIAPDVRMNPILLKPTSDVGSQVIIMGEAQGNRTAREYWGRKKALLPIIKDAFDSLAAENDIIVIEGAGSPAEINLKQDDIVNMGLAKLVDAPVLLVGDIDRGGVFASRFHAPVPEPTRCSAAMRAASTTCTPYLSCGRSRCSSCTSCTAATRARALRFAGAAGCRRAVDLTPWKYSKLVSVIVIVCVLLVYLAFSPLGIGA